METTLIGVGIWALGYLMGALAHHTFWVSKRRTWMQLVSLLVLIACAFVVGMYLDLWRSP